MTSSWVYFVSSRSERIILVFIVVYELLCYIGPRFIERQLYWKYFAKITRVTVIENPYISYADFSDIIFMSKHNIPIFQHHFWTTFTCWAAILVSLRPCLVPWEEVDTSCVGSIRVLHQLEKSPELRVSRRQSQHYMCTYKLIDQQVQHS